VYTFGSSGFLFRSNKLMYDRQTNSLWNHLTGEPVVGSLANGEVRLRVLPVVVTTWNEWRIAHPDTRVLALETGYRRDYSPGRPYGRYFASPDTMFPVSPRSDRLRTKDVVFGLRVGEHRKAYPLDVFRHVPVVNDRVGTTSVVVLGKAETRSVRAYERSTLTFQQGAGPEDLVETTTGARWRVAEERLTEVATGRTLPRLGGHLAFWFGWYAFFPDAEVYAPPR
jgi:hypothetical protein